MQRILIQISLLTTLLAFTFLQQAEARDFRSEHASSSYDPANNNFRGGRPRIILNNINRDHQRQGVKCLNAYPEDHAGFSHCINNERLSESSAVVDHPLLMPVPVSNPNAISGE